MTDPDDGSRGVWCRAELSPLGAYMLTITYDDDNALSLGRDQLLSYVATMAEALLRAQYAEGVRRQLRDQIGMHESVVLHTVLQLRETWPELPLFGGYEIRPCVSFEGRTSVDVWRGDTNVVQLASENVQEHIVHALRVYASADLDSAYRRFLIGEVGIERGHAGILVTTLARHLREE